MQPFPDKIHIEDAGMRRGSRLFRLEQDFRYFSPKYGLITVPAGFVTDGASIPAVFWNILYPFGPYFGSALVHDFLYDKNCPLYFERSECDDIFLEGMAILEVPWLTRRLMHCAVRGFGWEFFRKKSFSDEN